MLVAPPDISWNTVRLHCDGIDVDINNYLTNVLLDDGETVDEIGFLALNKASKEVLNIPEVGTDTTVIQENKIITAINVVNNYIDIYEKEEHIVGLKYPQAIVLHTNSELIVFDKEEWFSEMIVIKHGCHIKDLIYNDAINWEDIPEESPHTHFEFHTEIVEL